MAFASSVLPLLSAVFAKKGEKAGHTSVSHLLHFATATIKHELSTLVLKISLALVATGVLIFSIIMIGRHVNDAFQVYYANGPLLAGLFFGFISVLCFAGLFLLYQPLKSLSKVNSTIQTTIAAGQRIFELISVGLVMVIA